MRKSPCQYGANLQRSSAASDPSRWHVAPEAALWESARRGQQPPLTVLSRLVPVTLIPAALLWACTGPAPRVYFPLHLHPQPVVAWATAAGLLLPTAIFYIADAFLDASAWQWLGPTQKHSDSTSEAERTGAFVLHPRNAYSSHAQTAAGSYMLSRAYTDARASVASVAYGAVLFLMGIASFVWWASRRHAAQRIDSWLMETVCSAAAVSYFAVGAPEHEMALVAAWAMVTTWRAATFSRRGNLLWPNVAGIGGHWFAALSLGGCGLMGRYIGGLVALTLGLVLKMHDTKQGHAWGTAAFHYASAVGALLIWLWIQSLPLSAARAGT